MSVTPPPPAPPAPPGRPLAALRIALVYAAVSALWILFSDRLLHDLLSEAGEQVVQPRDVQGLENAFVFALGGRVEQQFPEGADLGFRTSERLIE